MENVIWIVILCFCIALNINVSIRTDKIVAPMFAILLCSIAVTLKIITMLK